MKIDTILWDFDGVIVDSMSIRDDAFRVALDGYPNDQVERLIEYHQKNGGLSRYHKFRVFFEQIRGEELTDEHLEKLTSVFSDYCLERLMRKDSLISATINFIDKSHEFLNFHIVSGSDQNELRAICKGLKIRDYFGEVLGSPTPKNQLVQDLMGRFGLRENTTGLVGDSVNDLEAARVNGIHFFGYRNPALSEKGVYLSDITDLEEWIS